jgi:hypothetical protein
LYLLFFDGVKGVQLGHNYVLVLYFLLDLLGHFVCAPLECDQLCFHGGSLILRLPYAVVADGEVIGDLLHLHLRVLNLFLQLSKLEAERNARVAANFHV